MSQLRSDLAGPFCAHCGQRDIPPYPSVRELAVDAFWELSGWDGRFASTVRTLVKQGAIGAIYGVTCLLGFILMIYWVSLLG